MDLTFLSNSTPVSGADGWEAVAAPVPQAESFAATDSVEKIRMKPSKGWITKAKDAYSSTSMYQSLHTVVIGKGLFPLEVQIRTKEMHSQAKFGFAAHWRYKKGDCMHSSYVLKMVELARWVVTWQCEAMMKVQSSIGYKDAMKPPCKYLFHSEDCPHAYQPFYGSDGAVFVM